MGRRMFSCRLYYGILVSLLVFTAIPAAHPVYGEDVEMQNDTLAIRIVCPDVVRSGDSVRCSISVLILQASKLDVRLNIFVMRPLAMLIREHVVPSGHYQHGDKFIKTITVSIPADSYAPHTKIYGTLKNYGGRGFRWAPFVLSEIATVNDRAPLQDTQPANSPRVEEIDIAILNQELEELTAEVQGLRSKSEFASIFLAILSAGWAGSLVVVALVGRGKGKTDT